MGQIAQQLAKKGLNSLECASQMHHDHLWKNTFLTLFEPFLVPKWPILRLFRTRWANEVKTGPKWAHFTCLCTPNDLG